MQDTAYKIVELTGTSEISIEDAVNTALMRANNSLQNLNWFELIWVEAAGY
jgi:flavin-binding protein dodecin